MSAVNFVVPYGSGEQGGHFSVRKLDGSTRILRGRLAREERPAPEHEPYPYGHEVEVTPGVCAIWHCQRTVFGWGDGNRECSLHRYEPLPVEKRDRSAEYEEKKRLLREDPEWAAKERERRRLVTAKLRQNPAYRNKHNARRRAKRAQSQQGTQVAV